MKNFFIRINLLAFMALAACSAPEPAIPIEFSKVCAISNEKKMVEVGGYLNTGKSVYCSNRGGRMECAHGFTETQGAGKSISADIEQGTRANQAEKLKSGYKREDIKIRDNNGNVIDLAKRVRLTGKMSVTPDLSVCLIQVIKIE